MKLRRNLLLGLAWIISIVLAMSGAFFYPLSEQGIPSIIAYEIAVILGISAIILLIYKEGYTPSSE